MSECTVNIKLVLSVQVWLPEDEVDDGEGEVTPSARERAWQAAMDAIPQNCEVFIDGEDKPPAKVYIEPNDSESEAEMWCE